jgi:trehalose 6-phosphate synthase/phosphatase
MQSPETKPLFESAAFKQYVAVNKRFTEAIEREWTEGDVGASFIVEGFDSV